MAQSYRGCSTFTGVEQEFRSISTGSPQPLLRADSVRAKIEARGYDYPLLFCVATWLKNVEKALRRAVMSRCATSTVRTAVPD
jgi:hypothetical protein